MPDMTETFIETTENPNSFQIDSSLMNQFELFTCSEYAKHIETGDVNSARQELFSKGLRCLENIPPTKNALFFHIKRAIFVAAFMYNKCMNNVMELPSPEDWVGKE